MTHLIDKVCAFPFLYWMLFYRRNFLVATHQSRIQWRLFPQNCRAGKQKNTHPKAIIGYYKHLQVF